jgi:hypothetical protein
MPADALALDFSYLRWSIVAGVVVFLIEKTDFIFYYLRLVGYGGARFERWKAANPNLHFVDFLAAERKTFFIALICCPFCLSTWFTFAVTALFWTDLSSLSWLGVTYLLVLATYILISKAKDLLN